MRNPHLYSQTDLDSPELHDLCAGTAAIYTHRAPGKETANEDSAALIPYDKDAGVLVIADGLGGFPEGDTASRLAVNTLSKVITKAAEQGTPLRDAILDGFERANHVIMERASGAATTLAVVELQDNTMRPYHVGDSMILVTGQQGKDKFQSVAHSPVGYAVESGMLDADEAVHHEERHIVSNVVGATDMRIEIGASIKLAARDTLILASDGLFDNLYVDEIFEGVRKGRLDKVAATLAIACRKRMQQPTQDHPSHPDDLSFIVYRLAAAK